MDPKLFADLKKSIRQAGAIERGKRKPSRVFEVIDVRSARKRTGLSQADFARLMQVSKGTLVNWEQGRRNPSGAARSLLMIAKRRPDVLREVFAE